MIKLKILFGILFVLTSLLTKSQCDWQSLGYNQDSSYLNKQSKGAETNALTVLEFAPDGTAYTLYKKYTVYNTNSPIQVLKLVNNKWKPLSMVGVATSGASNPILKIDNSGNVYLSYSMNYKLVCAKFNGITWQTLPTINFTYSDQIYFKFALDKNNSPYFLHTSVADSNKLTLKKYTGTSWINVGQNKFSNSLTALVNYFNIGNAFDLLIDTNLIPFIVSYKNVGTKNVMDIFTYNSNWIKTNSINTNTNTVAPFLKKDNNNTVYCYFVDSLNNHAVITNINATYTVAFQTPKIFISKLNFYFDNANTLRIFKGEQDEQVYTPFPTFSFSLYDINNLNPVQIGPNNYLDLNSDFYPIISPNKEFYLVYTEVGDPFYPKTIIKYINNNWEVVGEGEIGIIKSRTSKSTIRISKSGKIYVCYDDILDSQKVSVITYQNNNWSYVGKRGVSEKQTYKWFFELDKNDVPYLSYDNVYDTNRTIVKKFDGINWLRVGKTNFKDDLSYGDAANIYFNKQNELFINIYKSQLEEPTLFKFSNNNWQNVMYNQIGFCYNSNYYSNNIAFDTLGSFYSVNSNCFRGLLKDSLNYLRKINGSEIALKSSFRVHSFKINNSTNIPYIFYSEQGNNGSYNYFVKRFINNKWIEVGNFNNNYKKINYYSYNGYSKPDMTFDDSGNPYIIINEDSLKVALFMCKNNIWQKVGNSYVSNFPAGAFDVAIYNDRFYCIYTNKGAWLKTIDVPALASVNSNVDTCNDIKALLEVNVKNGLIYQWQINNGSSFIDLSNNQKYAGSNSRQLKITSDLSDLSQTKYRCIVKRSCTIDTTNIITFSCHYKDSIKAIPELVLFPNPTNKIFTIDCKRPINSLELYDVTGKVILSMRKFDLVSRVNVDVSQYPSGCYFARISYSDKFKILKVLKE
ncbi:MAG: T9SS type A sorting domain-containing protein [Bacteroidetes bacterium]|nr:T9SS type A sorting domain-containing protein [Bacteroidota bacterium]